MQEKFKTKIVNCMINALEGGYFDYRTKVEIKPNGSIAITSFDSENNGECTKDQLVEEFLSLSKEEQEDIINEYGNWAD